MKSYKKQSGFTLVELIVVIIILGILSATALPKFMDVTEKAYYSAVAGAAGGLGAGVALFHAQWVANGHTGAELNVQGFGGDDVDANADGWPVSVAADGTALTHANCLEVWNGVMQNPPSATTSTSAAATEDYRVRETSTDVCTFTYLKDTNTTRTFTYDASNGAVTITNNPAP